MDKTIEEIAVTENLKLILSEDSDPQKGSYITLKQIQPPGQGNKGEVIVPPVKIPQLLQALSSAALELTYRGAYCNGHADGSQEGK